MIYILNLQAAGDCSTTAIPGSHGIEHGGGARTPRKEGWMTTRRMMVAAALLALLLGVTRPAGADAPVNLNTASVAELEGLKGIGAAKAKAIVEHREKNGQFQSVDDLKLVRGIGDRMLDQLRPQLTVGNGKADGAPAAAAPPAPAAAKKP
jgi:competence protein ComEA